MKNAEETLAELGRRAVACKHFRWLPGMLMLDEGWGIRYLWSDDTWHHGVARDGQSWVRMLHGRLFVPDLSDPATLGCLLHLVREVYGNQKLWAFTVEDKRGNWSVTVRTTPQAWFYGHTEAEALVAALETAP